MTATSTQTICRMFLAWRTKPIGDLPIREILTIAKREENNAAGGPNPWPSEAAESSCQNVLAAGARHRFETPGGPANDRFVFEMRATSEGGRCSFQKNYRM